jgi:hypothetical protein
MANAPFNAPRNNRDGNRRSLRELMESGNGMGGSGSAGADDWGSSKSANDGVESTSAEETERILAALRRDQEERPPAAEDDPVLLDEMRKENDSLRSIVAELTQLLEETTSKGNESLGEHEQEYEAMLEDKSENIRRLHEEIQGLEAQLAGEPPPGAGAGELGSGGDPHAELSALADELEQERVAMQRQTKQLEGDRMQLREDEESMMRQMREMEMQMSKERAELARQRNELTRLHSEIRHELELATRDAEVNKRLDLLRRRAEPEVAEEKPAPKPGKKSARGEEKKPRPNKETGLFRRFFGGGGDK